MTEHNDIPSASELMAPLLEAISDGETHSRDELVEVLGNRFGLSEEQRNRRGKSQNLVFGNRIDWARSYFTQHNLIETPSKGHIRITPCGQHVLKHHRNELNNKFFDNFTCP